MTPESTFERLSDRIEAIPTLDSHKVAYVPRFDVEVAIEQARAELCPPAPSGASPTDIRPTVELLRLGERAARWFADGTRTDEEMDVETALKCIDGALGALEACRCHADPLPASTAPAPTVEKALTVGDSVKESGENFNPAEAPYRSGCNCPLDGDGEAGSVLCADRQQLVGGVCGCSCHEAGPAPPRAEKEIQSPAVREAVDAIIESCRNIREDKSGPRHTVDGDHFSLSFKSPRKADPSFPRPAERREEPYVLALVEALSQYRQWLVNETRSIDDDDFAQGQVSLAKLALEAFDAAVSLAPQEK